MSTILAHLRVKPGEEARFEGIARELYAGSHATDRGLRHYEYWRGAEPGTYYCLLAYDDHQSFIAHQTSDHHESASPLLRDVLADLRLGWVDPIDGASPLPPTEQQDPPEDADELTTAYTQRFAAEPADWWTPLRDA
jgi:quinol monooxygenase YgiN